MTKVQKLLYITYGAYFSTGGEGRLLNEHPQAWPYGPVFPTVRNKLLNTNFADITMSDKKVAELDSNEELKRIVTFVFEGFGKYKASWLTAWSHMDGSPWSQTTKKDGFRWGDRIPDEYIKSYFDKIIHKEV